MNRASARAYLASIANDLGTGQTLRILCPFCGGGQSEEVSLALTATDDGTFYCCHRSGCGEAGVVGGSSRLGQAPAPKPRPSRGYEAEVLSANLLDPAARRWAKGPRGPIVLSPSEIGLYTDRSYSVEVWALRDTRGRNRGYQVRRNKDEFGPKVVRTYKNPDFQEYPVYAYQEGEGDTLYIVEDPLSAAILRSWEQKAVALLGTHLSNDVALDLVNASGVEQYVVALDPGAEHDAKLVLDRLLCYTARPQRVVYPRKDIKDMTVPEVAMFLNIRRTIA